MDKVSRHSFDRLSLITTTVDQECNHLWAVEATVGHKQHNPSIRQPELLLYTSYGQFPFQAALTQYRMLRPATPLTLLLFLAFVLLLISVISTPIVKGIPLASYKGVDFGVFGNCNGTTCTEIKVGYTTGTYNYHLV